MMILSAAFPGNKIFPNSDYYVANSINIVYTHVNTVHENMFNSSSLLIKINNGQ